MKLREILRGIDITAVNADLNAEITGITIDSRKIKSGNLFAALPGLSKKESHGRIFTGAAAEAGATVVLTDTATDDLPYIIVKDPAKALAFASSNFYGNPAADMKIIGVTGTKGKTSTTHYIKSVLDRTEGVKAGLIGTNEISYGDVIYDADNTTPEATKLYSIFRDMKDSGITHVVMEVSSHSLAAGRVDPITFEVGAFLNLSQDHLDFHETMEAYAETKALLMPKCRRIAINSDDAEAGRMKAAAIGNIMTFAVKDELASLVAKNITLNMSSVRFDALTTGKMRRIVINTPGYFSVYNGLAAAAVLLALGMDLEDIAEKLSMAESVRGRAEVIPVNRDFTVMIDYAHSPESLKEILETVRPFTMGRIILVFGCGGNRDNLKRPIMGEIATELSDFTIITSDNPRFEVPGDIIKMIEKGAEKGAGSFVSIEDRKEAIKEAICMANKDDIVLIAGKGHETYQDVRGVKHHFDDREIVLSICGISSSEKL